MMNLNQYRIRTGLVASDDSLGRTGAFKFGDLIALSFFPDKEWEHVVVSRADRCPTWEEMCFIKDLFWEPEALVWQYHPPKSQNTSMHPYALHLWRKPGFDFPLPPSVFAIPGLIYGQR
jgi:hypothetical protein